MTDDDLLFERAEGFEQPTGFFLDHINTITDGLWGFAIPMMTFAIVYLSMNNHDPRKAFGAATFSTLILVTMLLALGVLGSEALIIAILLVSVGIIMNRSSGGAV